MADVFILIFAIAFGLITGTSVGIFVKCYFVQPYWENTKPPDSNKSPARVLFACALTYIFAAVLQLICFIVFLSAGWPATEPISFIMGPVYLIGLFLMIYVWIQRLETTFVNSAFELSKRFIKGLKYTFVVIIILGISATVLFIVGGGGDEEQTDATFINYAIIGIFVILFVGLLVFLLIVLLYSFISKLNQLRKDAESRLNETNDTGDYDLESMAMIQQLVRLQTKLTIAAILGILSSLISIPLTVVFDEGYELLPYAVDTLIGFYCIHCTIKTHDAYYEFLCKCCIKTCDLCCKTTQLDFKMQNHIVVHSNSNRPPTQISSGPIGGISTIIFTKSAESTQPEPTEAELTQVKSKTQAESTTNNPDSAAPSDNDNDTQTKLSTNNTNDNPSTDNPSTDSPPTNNPPTEDPSNKETQD